MTKLMSRPEELVLLAVWQLKDNAYLIQVQDFLSKSTGRDWSVGAVFVPLERLVRAGLAETQLGDATPERGGRRKKFYRLTKAGVDMLQELSRVHRVMWDGFPRADLDGGRV